MRQGYGGGFIIENNKLVGINLGSDFTAEHEWGISDIQKAFGVNQKEGLLGIEQREITRFPESCFHFKNKVKGVTFEHLVYKSWWSGEIEDYDPEVYFGTDDSLATQWRSSAFGIHVRNNKKYKEYLKEIFDAFKSLDGAIMFISSNGGKNPFERSGLFLGIKSRISKEDIHQMYDVDYDYQLLQENAQNTGIHRILDESCKKYYSLTPKWSKDITSEKNTDYSVMFWLNPIDQKNYHSGWYTVEDLKKWALGVGPIVKNKKYLAKDFILCNSDACK